MQNTALISRLLVIITLQEPSAVNVWQLKLLANYKMKPFNIENNLN